MELWSRVFRDGFAPLISTAGLTALAEALATDNPKLIQGATTTPPPHVCDWPTEAACAIGYSGWQGDGLETVGAVEEYFERLCHQADTALGEYAACRDFLQWADETPRSDMRRLLLAEVLAVLAEREG